MLIGVTVTNQNRSDIPDLEILMRGGDDYSVVFIDGLTPVKAEVSSAAYAGIPGEHIQGSRVGKRNIVLTLDPRPSYSTGGTVESVRKRLYNYLSPQSKVDLSFLTETNTYNISGIVESFESPLFVQLPRFQISILCDAYFTGPEVKVVEETTDNAGVTVVINDGDVPVPFVVTAAMQHATKVASGFTLSGGDGSFNPLQIVSSLPAQSSVAVNSEPGSKDVILNSIDPMIQHMVRGSGWPQLAPGYNEIKTQFTGGVGSNSVVISYLERFVGL